MRIRRPSSTVIKHYPFAEEGGGICTPLLHIALPKTRSRNLGSGREGGGELKGSKVDDFANRTYYILHPLNAPLTICACGGWSFRKTLYGGDSAPSPLRMPEKRDPAVDRASIRAIFTSPQYARKGLGTMMMRYCEARAREGKAGETEGFKRLEMGATLSGVQLYERCEYVRSGRVDVVQCPNGEGIRILHMTKDLDEEDNIDGI